MISPEAVATLPTHPWKEAKDALVRIPGWLVGYGWGVRGDDALLALAKSDLPDRYDVIGEHEKKMPGVPVTEDVSLRIPFVAGIDDVTKTCTKCSGDGQHDCNCSECDFGCRTCDGDGQIVVTKGRIEDPGQRVFRSGDVTTVVQDRLGVLLDGLTIVRLGDGAIDPLGGVDESGRLIALVMPMRAEVRTPAVRP